MTRVHTKLGRSLLLVSISLVRINHIGLSPLSGRSSSLSKMGHEDEQYRMSQLPCARIFKGKDGRFWSDDQTLVATINIRVRSA